MNAQSTLYTPATAKPDLKVIPINSRRIFANKNNFLRIEAGTEYDSLTIHVSQGSCYLFDKNVYLVNPEKPGLILVEIFKSLNGRFSFVGKKEFTVLKQNDSKLSDKMYPTPSISILGFISGNIIIDSLKKADKLSINKEYSIKSATFYITGPQGTDSQINTISNEKLDETLLQVFDLIEPNSSIVIDNIKIADKKNRTFKIAALRFIAVK